MRIHSNTLRFTVGPILALMLLVVGVPLAGATVVLDVDFDSQPLDQIIGTGGASAGQPVSTGGVNAYVRSGPSGSPVMEITDHLDYGARTVHFAFLGDAEYSTGVLFISATLHFVEFEDYVLYVRESGSTAESFLNLRFDSSGQIYHGDKDDAGMSLVGSYVTGLDQTLQMRFDLDAGTCEVEFAGAEIVAPETHGVTGSGIGSLHIGFDHDPDLDGLYYVDDILAELDATPVAGSSLSRVKSSW